MSLSLGSRTILVPGAYAITKIIQLGGQNLPVFNVGVQISKQMGGIPYTEGVGGTPALSADKFILPYSDPATYGLDAGQEGDNEGMTFFNYAKKVGAGVIFTLNVNPLTKATGGVVQNATPANALTFATRKYGAHQNDISLTIAASIHTITPPKNVTYLTANSGTGLTVTVKNILKYKAGDVVLLTSNAYAVPVSKTIDSVDPVAKSITFTVAVAASALTADYARIFQEDTASSEISTSALDSATKVANFYAASTLLSVSVSTGITLMPVTLAKVYVQNLTSLTKATSPTATNSDWQAVADNITRWNEEFALVNKFYFRVLGLVTSDATNHAAFVTTATAARVLNKPLQIVTGCALGDTNQIARAFALNSDEIQLAGWGLDGFAAYLSYAAELFGIRLANEIAHNQTNDTLVASTVEKGFTRDEATLPSYVTAGVMAIMLTKYGYKIVQGVTTYQDQSVTFVPDTKKTYLIMLRDISDFKLRMWLEVLEAQVGADGVTAQLLSGILIQTGDKFINELQYGTGYKVVSITKTGNAFNVKDEVQGLLTPTDFIGMEQTLILN